MQIGVTIEGITPLLCNRFTDAAAEAATKGSRSSAAGQDRGTPMEQAEPRLYHGLRGNLIIPQPNLFRCLIEGGRFHKIGKSQVTTAKQSLLFSCMDIEAAEIPIEHQEPWRVDTRAVRIPSTGGRILCHRPMFDDWKLSFVINLDEDIVNRRLLREIVDDAGRRIGLGDFRPSSKGPYGKFCVIRWEEQRIE